MDLQLDITKETQINEAAKKLLDFAGSIKTFAFAGPMGSGKTTFIKHLCKELGSADHMSSPTYAIVNEYSSPAGKIYHFDLYRIKVVDELFDLGFEEYLSSGNYCFIEWPEIAEELFTSPYLEATITNSDGKRQLSAIKC